MEKATVTRTVVVESEKLPRRLFRVFVELEELYRSMVKQLVLYAVGSKTTSFTKLRMLKYRELRNTYPQLPSHYAYTACQDACTRAKSFLKLKKEGLTSREHPEVKSVSIWLDDHLWKLEGLTRVGIATHRGWIHVDINPHKQFWRYVNSGWRFRSECRVKLNKRERKLILYFVFAKDVELYQPKGYVTVDVNENSIAVLVDGRVYLFETNMEKIVLGYYYRRKRVQEKYDKLYGPGCRTRRRVLRKLNEKGKKNDARWKIANIVVREAVKHGYAIAMEKLGKRPAENMIKRVEDKQLKHRIYQASFRGVQRAVEEKAKEHGVSVVYVDPRNTSKQCPVHGATIRYDNSSRIGICSTGGERWHRDVVACFNLLLKALGGDGSDAPNHPGLELDGSPVPLGSTATHEPIQIPISVWGRWKSLDTKEHKQTKTNIQGQTVIDELREEEGWKVVIEVKSSWRPDIVGAGLQVMSYMLAVSESGSNKVGGFIVTPGGCFKVYLDRTVLDEYIRRLRKVVEVALSGDRRSLPPRLPRELEHRCEACHNKWKCLSLPDEYRSYRRYFTAMGFTKIREEKRRTLEGFA